MLPCFARILKTCFDEIPVMCNRANSRDVGACPDESSTRRTEPVNQAHININIAEGLETYLNDIKEYIATLASLVNTDMF